MKSTKNTADLLNSDASPQDVIVYDEDDCPELGEEFWSKARPFRQFFDEEYGPGEADKFLIAVSRARGQRGKQKAPLKKQVAIRLDHDVLAALKATGRGWQTRVNGVLRQAFMAGNTVDTQ